MVRPCKKQKTCTHADVGMNCHGACLLTREMVWCSDLKLHEIDIARMGMLDFNLDKLNLRFTAIELG